MSSAVVRAMFFNIKIAMFLGSADHDCAVISGQNGRAVVSGKKWSKSRGKKRDRVGRCEAADLALDRAVGDPPIGLPHRRDAPLEIEHRGLAQTDEPDIGPAIVAPG